MLFYIANLLKGPVGWEAGLLPINTKDCVIMQSTTVRHLNHNTQKDFLIQKSVKYLWP